MEIYLKIMPEYGCDPLWESNDGIVYEYLDIHDSYFDNKLKQSILEWSSIYQSTLNQDYPPDSAFITIEDELIFELEGLRIWDAIVQNYSDKYFKIIYYSITFGENFNDRDIYFNLLKDKFRILNI